MVYPVGEEVTASDGSKRFSRRPSYYNEEISLKNYNVYVTSLVGNLACVKLSKELIKCYKDDVEIILLNKSKVQVSCKTAAVANKIIKDTTASKNFNFYIPQQKVEVKGRIYMPKDISEKAAFDGMTVKNRINTNAPLPTIVEVYRVPYFDKDPTSGAVNRIDSDFMLVSFCGSHIPTHVLFDNCLLIPVQPYFEPILQCKNCWFFGHSKRACRGKEKCLTCGLIHTGEMECTALPFCVNCKGNHKSNDKKCPEFLKRKELSKAKALKTFPIVEVQPTSVSTSFNIFSNIAFPGLPPKSFSKPPVEKVPEQIGKKRRVLSSERIVKADVVKPIPTVSLAKKLTQDLSRQKPFFNSIIEEVKASAMSGEKLESIFSKKINEMLEPASEDTVLSLELSDGSTVPPKRS